MGPDLLHFLKFLPFMPISGQELRGYLKAGNHPKWQISPDL
jgi:hypothetical protein